MGFSATDELLVRGTSAARDNDREQARFYLEWVLRDHPTTEQESTAYYWLSRVADDPAERRVYLERVLSREPLHADARRDLALLDGRLKPEEMIDPNRPLAPLTLGGEAEPPVEQEYRCPRCGGILRFSVEHQVLACGFCGYQETAPERAPLDEQDWFATAFSARGHRWVLSSVLTMTCQNCGAVQTLPSGQVSGTCAFCASPHLVQTPAERDLIAPDGVVPFAIDHTEARKRLQRWRATQRGMNQGSVDGPRPVYLPFWTFDVDGEVRWQSVDDSSPWSAPAQGSEHLFFNDLLVPATQTLPETLLMALHFDTANALPYSNDLLAGWPAQLYSVPVTTASLRARERARTWCREQIGTTSVVEHRAVSITAINLAVTTYKLLLLPVWVATQRGDGEPDPIVINGQTGEVHGEGKPGLLRRWLTRLAGSEV